MNREKKHVGILHDAVEKLRRTTGLTVEIQPRNFGADTVLDTVIRIVWQDVEWHFAVDVKDMLTPATVGLAAQQRKELDHNTLLVARYVTPNVADQLKQMNIPFIDTAGNAYIYETPLLIFIRGNKLPDKARPKPTIRAFRPAGIKVLFAFLCNPGLENRPFREIADKADVALGTVEMVVHDLKRMDYLLDMQKRGRRITGRADLLARWITEYPEQLRPKQMVGHYKAEDDGWWKQVQPRAYKAYWGGEVAANILTRYLKPQIVTIYTRGPAAKLVLDNRLQKKDDGPIEILQTFWGTGHNTGHPDLVHPLLIYADLLATGDARNIETAEILYDQKLDRLIREN